MFELIEHDRCMHILHFGVPVIVTFILGSISLLAWTCWDDRRMKKEDEAFEKSLLHPEPLDVEEIPRKYLYFQKLTTQIYTNHICSGETIMDKMKEVLEWMLEHEHPNAIDMDTIMNLLEDDEVTNREYYQALLWIDTACRIWSNDPKWTMPAWMPTVIRRNRSWTVS